MYPDGIVTRQALFGEVSQMVTAVEGYVEESSRAQVVDEWREGQRGSSQSLQVGAR
jgi:hypothetical protein